MGFVVNHVGLCVTDAERSRRFYEAVLGFEFWHQLDVPDDMAAKLLDLPPPLGSTAVYLRQGEFEKAVEAFTRAIDTRPAADLYEGRARAYRGLAERDMDAAALLRQRHS